MYHLDAMEFFTCKGCGISQPLKLSAFGLPGVPICDECYKKGLKKGNNGDSLCHIQASVETDKDSLPK